MASSNRPKASLLLSAAPLAPVFLVIFGFWLRTRTLGMGRATAWQRHLPREELEFEIVLAPGRFTLSRLDLVPRGC
jgi:hypothetical protein